MYKTKSIREELHHTLVIILVYVGKLLYCFRHKKSSLSYLVLHEFRTGVSIHRYRFNGFDGPGYFIFFLNSIYT